MEATQSQQSKQFSLIGGGGFGMVGGCIAGGGKEGSASTGGAAGSSDGPAADDGAKEAAEQLLAEVEARWMEEAQRDADGAVICAVCGRPGHPCCGLRYWQALRAAWLRVTEEEVRVEPASFEDEGLLQIARSAGHAGDMVRELSDLERDELEDCLDAVQRPFPRLRRSVPLAQAVLCAMDLWDHD